MDGFVAPFELTIDAQPDHPMQYKGQVFSLAHAFVP